MLETEIARKYGLKVWAISNHLVGQSVCDRIDERHKGTLPARVWGDGKEDGVRSRAVEEMKNTARAAARFSCSDLSCASCASVRSPNHSRIG